MASNIGKRSTQVPGKSPKLSTGRRDDGDRTSEKCHHEEKNHDDSRRNVVGCVVKYVDDWQAVWGVQHLVEVAAGEDNGNDRKGAEDRVDSKGAHDRARDSFTRAFSFFGCSVLVS
jgi:hypothetical protein